MLVSLEHRGHNGKVRSLAWLPDDTKLVSAGVDGAVYEWRLKDFKRSKENVLKVRPMQISSTALEPAEHSDACAVKQYKSFVCSALLVFTAMTACWPVTY